MLIGGALGFVAALLLGEFVARFHGTPDGWGIAIGVLALAAVPTIAVGIVVGIAVDNRAASAVSASEHAPTHPIGGIAGLLMGVWAALIFGIFNTHGREMLSRHPDAPAALVASAILLLRVGMLAGIWLIGRGTSRAISKALDTRGGGRVLPDVTVIALLFWFGAFNLASAGVGDLLSEPPRILFHPAIDFGLALLAGGLALALLRRSQYAFHLALAVAALVVVTMIVTWVLSPADADFMQGFRDTLIASAVMVAFVWYVRWRLRQRAR